MSKEFRVALAATITILVAFSHPAQGRGGGGGFGGGGFGGGGFGGGFGGGDFGGGMRGGFDGGMGGPGGRDFGDMGGRDFGMGRMPGGAGRMDGYPGGMGGEAARPQAAAVPRVSDQDLRQAANTNYNWGPSRTIASDGGFGALASAGGIGTHETAHYDAAVMARQADAVRIKYNTMGINNLSAWAKHPEAAWAGAALFGNGWGWGYTNWGALSGWWGLGSEAAYYYDYGNNIIYNGDTVYYGSQPAATASDYYLQAQTLSQSVPVSPTEKKQKSNWKSLGVFSLVQGSQTSTSAMFQLAVNRQGAISGSYYNELSGDQKPVTGAVDKKRGRASWIVGDNKEVVYDSGINNLLQAQSPLLIHFGKNKTQQWELVRLQQAQGK